MPSCAPSLVMIVEQGLDRAAVEPALAG